MREIGLFEKVRLLEARVNRLESKMRMSHKASDDKALYSVNEFLSQFAIGRTAFYEEVNEGRLKPVKRGKRTLIPAAEAEKWLKAHEAF